MVEEYKIGSDSSARVGQEQIHGLLFGEKLSWQSIIYDLINTSQLDPWDIDISLLANKYLDKVRALEEENFFVSSKVLFAAALLLRMKSEILLNKDIASLDDILFGKKEEDKKYVQERIELNEDIPLLIPRTPLPRFKKVTLSELMSALGGAIQTENRRIRRVVIEKNREMEGFGSLPKFRINIKDQINSVYSKLKVMFSNKKEKVSFSSFSGESYEEKISSFGPLLHLDNQHKIFLDQEKHFEEIWIWLKSHYDEFHKEERDKMMKEALEYENEEEKFDAGFSNPVGSKI